MSRLSNLKTADIRESALIKNTGPNMLNKNKNFPREPEQQLLSVQSLYLVRTPLHALTAPS